MRPPSRRKFLIGCASTAATFALANAGLYVVGSAVKKLDGSTLASGAKTCPIPPPSCNLPRHLYCCFDPPAPYWMCDFQNPC